MYRIELAPGEVTVFRTIEELATGVRNGLITSKARIYHSASEKWLPIEFHPHYKRALDLASGGAPESTASKPRPKPSQPPRPQTLTFLNVPVSPTIPAVLPAPVAPQPAPVAPQREGHHSAAPAGAPAPMETQPVTGHSSAEQSPAAHSWFEQRSAVHSSVTERSAPAARPPLEAFDEARAARSPMLPPPAEHAPAPMPPVAGTATPALAPKAPAADRPVVSSPYAPAPADARRAARAPVPSAPVLDVFDPSDEAGDASDDAAAAGGEWPERSPSALPPVSASPVLELPKITYPEITPLEDPVAGQPTAASRRRRMAHLAGAVLLLAIGGYASSSLLAFGGTSERFVAAGTLADRPASPARTPAESDAASPALSTTLSSPAASSPGASFRPTVRAQAPAPAPAGAPALTSKPPSRGSMPSPQPALRAAASPAGAGDSMPPASSGFARALEPRAIVTSPMKPATTTPAERPGDSSAAAPPPIDTKVAVPVLPGSALVGQSRQQGDSALKKILRAVSGGKEVR